MPLFGYICRVWFPEFLLPVVLVHTTCGDGTEKSVPKRRLIKFRRRGITQKKEYNTLDLLIAISNTILNGKGAIAPPVLKPFFNFKFRVYQF
jgi:hypothetical protein